MGKSQGRQTPTGPRITLWALTHGQRSRYLAAIAAMAAGTVFLLLVPFLLKRPSMHSSLVQCGGQYRDLYAEQSLRDVVRIDNAIGSKF